MFCQTLGKVSLPSSLPSANSHLTLSNRRGRQDRFKTYCARLLLRTARITFNSFTRSDQWANIFMFLPQRSGEYFGDCLPKSCCALIWGSGTLLEPSENGKRKSARVIIVPITLMRSSTHQITDQRSLSFSVTFGSTEARSVCSFLKKEAPNYFACASARVSAE